MLGPLEVRAGGERLALGGRKQRALLAILLLHANETVSTDRLVALLWGEAPPGTALTALHGHVSQLRKLLEPDRDPGAQPRVLLTHEPGYVLRLAPEQLDLERFRALTRSARTATAEGRHGDANALLREALALWRGPPLADLENEPFAQSELPRLAELRLAAVEESFEADLACGGRPDLVAELESHVARNPLRERPRGQLMLALYRAGRQAEALRVFQEARRTLVEEIGIEPGPDLRRLEQAILQQAPALDLTPPRERVSAPPAAGPGEPRWARRRVPLRAFAALVVLGAAAGLAALLAGGATKSPPDVRVAPGSVAVIDPATDRVTGAVRIGGTPTSLSVGEGGVWVLDADRQAVSRIDPRTRALRTFGTGSVPTDLAAGAGALWVANGRRTRAQFVGPLATTVSSIDTDSSAIRATVQLPPATGRTSNRTSNHIAVARDAVWVVNPDFSVSRIDPRSARIERTVAAVSAVAVAAGDGSVWTLDDDDTLTRVDRSAAAPRVRLATNGLSGIAVGAGAVWAVAPYDGLLWRIDPTPRVVQRTIPVGEGASFVTVGGGAVWVVNALRGTVSRVDPATNRLVATIQLGGTPRSAAFGAGRLWVTVAGAEAEAASETAAAGALPASTCGRVVHSGAGSPDRLIVSDLPLRGGSALPTRQMSQAIAFVLRGRGFRAGRFTVGYQSCDDSTAQTGIFDSAKCAANAKAFVASRRVIGIVGPYNSGCAVEQIPIAGRAAGGALAMISPTNADVGLTRAGPASPEGALRSLYPTGRRNYARLFPTEGAQGAADAQLAVALGARRVFVLSDGGYGESMAVAFRRAARRLGLRVVGARRWSARSRGYRELAATVAAARPDTVFVSGLLDTNGGAVIRALRARLRSAVRIISMDGLLPVSKLFAAAGEAAAGVYLSVGGLAPQQLGPGGRNFVSDFAATQPDAAVHRHSVYAAAAAATMLDAIAGSDGTRASVTRRLLGTEPRRGILGSYRLDANGDVDPSPITIVRARRGGGSDAIESTDGATYVRVIRPAPALVR